jgi:hypothetical protein
MKRITTALILSAMVLFTLPLAAGSAAPLREAVHDVDQNFAPDSIVRFEHLTIEDGLSQNAGLAIFQDSRGYLWIGSQDGLNRYDGYAFKIYFNTRYSTLGKMASLPSQRWGRFTGSGPGAAD